MTIPHQQINRITALCAGTGMSMTDQSVFVQALMATPSQARAFRKNCRDNAIRSAATQLYGGLSERQQADLLHADLIRVTPGPVEPWPQTPRRPQGKFEILTHLAELGAKELSAAHIRTILGGARTRPGA